MMHLVWLHGFRKDQGSQEEMEASSICKIVWDQCLGLLPHVECSPLCAFAFFCFFSPEMLLSLSLEYFCSIKGHDLTRLVTTLSCGRRALFIDMLCVPLALCKFCYRLSEL